MPQSRTPLGRSARLFYPTAAVLMLLLAFVGFSKFYLHGMAHPGRPIAPPIRTLVIAHGVAMTGWLLLLIAQTMLIATGRRRAHMRLGKVGIGLAGAILVLGIWLAVASARVTPADVLIWGLSPRAFMVVPFMTVLIFAGFVTIGIMYRRKPEVHRSMMTLATLSVLAAAVSRIEPLNSLYLGTMWERLFGPFLVTLLVGVLLVLARSALTRRLDRWLACGLAVLIVTNLMIMQIAPTAAWDQFTALLVP